MSNTSSARRSQRVAGRTMAASGPVTTLPAARTGGLFRSWRPRAWERLRTGSGGRVQDGRREGGRREEIANGFGWSSGRIWCNLECGRAVGCDVAGVCPGASGHPHIRLIFGRRSRTCSLFLLIACSSPAWIKKKTDGKMLQFQPNMRCLLNVAPTCLLRVHNREDVG